MHVWARTPSVHEQAGCEEERAGDAGVQASFGDGYTRFTGTLSLFGIRGRGAEVQPVLRRVDECADRSADSNSELDQACLERVEAVAPAERLDDGREEEEENAPCEADPEGEEHDDRLGEEHLCGPHEGDFQLLGDGCLFELGFREDFLAGGFAELGGAFREDHVAAGFAEDEPEKRDQRGVVDELDVVDPEGKLLASKSTGF